MGLSKRLQAVADLVKKKDRPADIGCDHGYVSIYLVREKICDSVIAMDVNQGPLLRAKENIEREGLGPYIETRLSDGAAALSEGEADTLICAGMGGKLIIQIVKEALKHLFSVNTLILQPQSEIWLVRRYLAEQNFLIVRENMILEEGKYYPMLRAERRQGKAVLSYSGLEEYYGPLLLKERHPVLFQYLKKEREITQSAINSLHAQKNGGNIVRRQKREQELLEKLSCIEDCLLKF